MTKTSKKKTKKLKTNYITTNYKIYKNKINFHLKMYNVHNTLLIHADIVFFLTINDMHISLRFVPFLPPSMRHSHVDKIIVGGKDGGARCHKVQTHNGQMKIFVFQKQK